MKRGKMASEIPETFDSFGPQLNTLMSVRILLKYFRRKLFQFEWSKTVSNLGMWRFMCTDQEEFRLLSYKSPTLLHYIFNIVEAGSTAIP